MGSEHSKYGQDTISGHLEAFQKKYWKNLRLAHFLGGVEKNSQILQNERLKVRDLAYCFTFPKFEKSATPKQVLKFGVGGVLLLDQGKIKNVSDVLPTKARYGHIGHHTIPSPIQVRSKSLCLSRRNGIYFKKDAQLIILHNY